MARTDWTRSNVHNFCSIPSAAIESRLSAADGGPGHFTRSDMKAGHSLGHYT